MTTLDILGGDWRISFDDENVNQLAGQAGLRKVERISGPVRESLEIYSAIAENASYFQAMTFKNPATPTTPNAFVLANDYFMPRSSMEWLKEGAWSANWALKTVGPDNDTAGHGVIKINYVVGLGTDFAAGDIGRRVTQGDSGDTGTLLDFDIDQDGSLCAWIRPDDSTPVTGDLFDGTGTLIATGGTGSVDSSSNGGSGSMLAPAIQAIGSVPTATEVYVVQNRIKLSDHATNTFQWWDTDPNVSLGIISIVTQVQVNGSLIADGDLEVFARQYTALYDNFRLNVSGGGFSALPLASQPDLNNTTGYRTFTTTSSSGTFNVGNGFYVGLDFASATKKGIITAVSGTNPTITIQYYPVGDLTDFANSDTITEYDYVAAADGDGAATVNVVSDTSGGPTDAGAGEGGTVTLALGAVTNVDFDGDGTNENYSVTANAQSLVPVAKVYERFKWATRRGATAADLFGAGTNVPGETYRGNEGTFEYDANTSTMNDGEDLSITARAGFSARLTAQNTTPADSVPSYIVMMDIQTSLTTSQPANDDLVSDEGGDGVRDVTIHAGGTLGIQRYTVSKQSPLGTFTGSQLFLSRGVIIVNPAPADTQAYTATPDNSATPLNPPNTISVAVQNTRAGDRIMVARDNGTAGVINRDQFGGMATAGLGFNNQDDDTIRVAGTIDSEVPDASVVRVKENSLIEEHRYYYDAVTKVASGEFSLITLTGGNTGTATASSSATQLVDDGRNFLTDGVQVGMLVRNTTLGKTTHVWEVTGFATTGLTSNDTLLVRALYGTPDDWDSTDTYIINRLIQTYANTDDLFDLILDVEEDTGTDGSPGTESNSFVKQLGADFDVVVEVRQGKVILPFSLNQTIGDSSVTITAVRQEDTIAV